MKEDASMKQESLGLNEQCPSERILKLQTLMFTNATFYFCNATISAFNYGLMVSKERARDSTSLGV
jgi:hypothetical protein